MKSESSDNKAMLLSDGITSDSVSSEMQRILRVAGIESAPIDPSSAKYLRELIAIKLDEVKVDNPVKVETPAPQTQKQSKMNKPGPNPSRMKLTKPFAVSHILSKIESARNEADKIPATSDTKSSLAQDGTSTAKTVTPSPIHVPSAISSSDKISTTPNRIHSTDTAEPDTAESYSSLKEQLASQQKTIEEQTKALLELTSHMRELATAVQSLQQTVQSLEPSSSAQVHPQHTAQRIPHENNPPANANANANRPQNNGNEFQRAHMLAHHVAWRVTTFPLRAILFYLKYEYRVWLVMYRLAKRDVLNPFREAGMIFQLGFALIIVYGRIAPALERTVNEQKRKQEHSGANDGAEAADDDYYYDYDDAFLEDAEFQIQALVTAILAGFLYHVGVFGLVYRFFFRDRLHIRIWNDLREGVELTATYGLDFDQDPPPERNDNANEHQNGNEDANANNMNNMEEEERRNNNNMMNDNNINIPQPPNRNRNLQNVEDDHGPLAELANVIGNGINDFFMGHGRRRRAAEQNAQAAMAAAEARVQAQQQQQPQLQVGQELDQDQDETAAFDPIHVHGNAGHRNPILGLFSDIVCLFYSFFVSILPGWNYEQQLRDIRDDDDRRLRALLQREAEVLRNQHLDGDGESGSEDEDENSESTSDSEE